MKERITICGAGLVGSLLSIYLIQRGFRVRVIEKRTDPRTHSEQAGRSINLAISHRGLHALKDAMPGFDQEALKLAVPMRGRRIHDAQGNLTYQPYGNSSQHINSIGRGDLTLLLIAEAEKAGVEFLFDHTCEVYNPSTKQWHFSTGEKSFIQTEPREIVIGADGAFSAVRKQVSLNAEQGYILDTLDYGYKELDISIDNSALLNDREALHIWPRERFMLIALPNIDGSYTATLFLPMEGEVSFEKLNTNEAITTFFNNFFSDTKELFPDLCEQFQVHPTSRLFTVHSDLWHNDHTLLIGDAAHALVPFYGQGMNAGFEDCRILAEIIDANTNAQWTTIFDTFFKERKNNADAIAALALQNFIEMRDLVADKEFLIRKKIEAYLNQAMPDLYIPQYTMVSFMDTPYAEAQAQGKLHQQMLDKIMKIDGITECWPDVAFEHKAMEIAHSYLKKKPESS